MSKRTKTLDLPQLTIRRPGTNVTYEFPNTDHPNSTYITIPEGSKWAPNAHWHEKYTEYIRVRQGRLRVILNGHPREVQPQDGAIRIEKFTVHEFMRADVDEPIGQGDEEDVIVEEWTDPADGVKEVFFRNILGAVIDAGHKSQLQTFLQLMMIMQYFDNYEVFYGGKYSVTITHWIFAIATSVAHFMGLKPWYAEYTPDRLYNVAGQVYQQDKVGKKL